MKMVNTKDSISKLGIRIRPISSKLIHSNHNLNLCSSLLRHRTFFFRFRHLTDAGRNLRSHGKGEKSVCPLDSDSVTPSR